MVDTRYCGMNRVVSVAEGVFVLVGVLKGVLVLEAVSEDVGEPLGADV